MKRHHPGILESSGNVFADLELSNPEERFAKAESALSPQSSVLGPQSSVLGPPSSANHVPRTTTTV
jgi:hypothetical protein